jgi:alpha-tubulin suppressor-like RCC1 family protein
LKNGLSIQGATAALFSLIAGLPDDGGRFSVRISNNGGTMTSNEAVLHVEPAGVVPAIALNPSNASVQVGQQAVFGVQASGTAPLTYQWLRNGTPIPGAVQASLVAAGLSLTDDGARFSVVVSNPFGTATSSEAVLSVTPTVVPSLIGTLQGAGEVSRGASATFSVVPNGTPPFQFQWRRDGVAIPGATSASYTQSGVTLDDHLTAYSVVVSNAAGIATSKPLVLRIAQAPVLGAGRFFSIAASPTAGVSTWGSNDGKTLGRNPELDRALVPGAVTLTGAATVIQVAGGERHTLVLRSDGSVWAWGINFDGQLGNGIFSGGGNPFEFVVPGQVQFPPGTLIRKIAAGSNFSLALDSNGKVWGWGFNGRGETGNGAAGGDGVFNGWFRPVAAALPVGLQIVDIAAGSHYGLALTSDGAIWGWGQKQSSVPFSSAPRLLDIAIVGVRPISLAAAYEYALFIADDGSAWQWGPGATGPSRVILEVPSGLAFVGFAGGANHTLYLTSDGIVHASGQEDFGVLGNGQAGTNVVQSFTRTLTIGPPAQRVIAIAAGERHSLAILADGSVVGWGANSPGQLGDGTETTRPLPVSSSGLDLE